MRMPMWWEVMAVLGALGAIGATVLYIARRIDQAVADCQAAVTLAQLQKAQVKADAAAAEQSRLPARSALQHPRHEAN